MDLSNIGFDEALARLIQTDPQEAEEAADSVKRGDEEVNSPWFSRRLPLSKSAAVRTRRATASRS